MGKPSLKKGMLILMDGKEYRIVECDAENVLFINMSGPVSFLNVSTKDVLINMENGEFTESGDAGIASCQLSAKERKSMENRRKIIEKLLNDTPSCTDLFRKGSRNIHKKEAAEQMGISVRRLNDLVTRYLRSGNNVFSLMDMRNFNNSGRSGSRTSVRNGNRKSMGYEPLEGGGMEKNDEKEEALKYGFSLFEQGISAYAAYTQMLDEYYGKAILVDNGYVLEAHPELVGMSYKIFLHYIYENIPERTIRDHRKKQKEKQNMRPHTGTQQTGVVSIGSVFQIDECEIPVQMVDDRNRINNVGKAVVYCIFDSFSEAVVGIYVGFKNNSNSGLFSVILTLLESHVPELQRYNVPCTDEDFPSLVMPEMFISDCGSEYTSKKCEEMLERHGISIEHASKGTGSEKGGAENFFRRFQKLLEANLMKYGYITDKNVTGEDAKKNAVISIQEMKRITYEAVVCINTTDMPGYIAPPDMVFNHVRMTPAKIWKYEKENEYDPRNVNDENRISYMFDILMDNENRKISAKEGIYFKGRTLRYFSNEDWFLRMITEKNPQADIRCNPDYIDYVFVRYGKRIHKVPLAPRVDAFRDLAGMSWADYDLYWEESRKGFNPNASLATKMQAGEEIRKTVDESVLLSGEGENNSRDMKTNRALEKREYERDPESQSREMFMRIPGEELRDPDAATGSLLYSADGTDEILGGQDLLEEIPDNELFGPSDDDE